MITPDFCGAYDGRGTPLTGGAPIETPDLLESARPFGHLLFQMDPDDPPKTGTGIAAECVVVLSGTQPIPIPDDVAGHAIAAMDQGLAVYVMGVRKEDISQACSYLIGLAGGGRA